MMRMFTITVSSLLALLLLATSDAKPQGYNYGSGQGQSGFASFNPLGSRSSFLGAPSSTQNNFIGASNSGGFGTFGGLGFGRGSGAGGGGALSAFGNSNSQRTGLNGYQDQQQYQASNFGPAFVHKQFITYEGPEDQDSLQQTKRLVIGRPQRNYRVVFIKAPSSSNANVKLSAEYAPQEEKTVIYVLSKKDNQLEVDDIATPAPTVPSKPEVYFIKYKTDEEAAHAQRQIQSEYDQIEGTSELTDGGVAPQQSVVGILDGGGLTGDASSTSAHRASSNSGAGSTYLPPRTK